jgi:hypothetical protein
MSLDIYRAGVTPPSTWSRTLGVAAVFIVNQLFAASLLVLIGLQHSAGAAGVAAVCLAFQGFCVQFSDAGTLQSFGRYSLGVEGSSTRTTRQWVAIMQSKGIAYGIICVPAAVLGVAILPSGLAASVLLAIGIGAIHCLLPDWLVRFMPGYTRAACFYCVGVALMFSVVGLADWEIALFLALATRPACGLLLVACLRIDWRLVLNRRAWCASRLLRRARCMRRFAPFQLQFMATAPLLYLNTPVVLSLCGDVVAGFFAALERLVRGLASTFQPVVQIVGPRILRLGVSRHDVRMMALVLFFYAALAVVGGVALYLNRSVFAGVPSAVPAAFVLLAQLPMLVLSLVLCQIHIPYNRLAYWIPRIGIAASVAQCLGFGWLAVGGKASLMSLCVLMTLVETFSLFCLCVVSFHAWRVNGRSFRSGVGALVK